MLCPEIGFLFDGTQAGIAQIASLAVALLAPADQNADDLVGQTQIAVEAQKYFQLFGIQGATQQTLDFPVKGLEIGVAVHGTHHIGLAVGRPLAGDEGGLGLGVQTQLPQKGGGAGVAVLGHVQGLSGLLRPVAGGEI